MMDKLELLFEHNVDLDNRTIYLFNEIDSPSSLSVVKSLQYLDRTDGEINLMINSCGGDIDCGNGIIDALLQLKNRVNGVVLGHASSMAAIILQACDYRIATKHSSMLIHAGMEEMFDTPMGIAARSEGLDKELDREVELFYKKMKFKNKKITKKDIRIFLIKDKVYNAKEALDLGLVDEIRG